MQFFVNSTRGNKLSNSCHLNIQWFLLKLLKYFLDDADNETVKKFDFFAYKYLFKYLFYKFNNCFFFNGLNTVPVRHSKINENKNAMKEIQNRDWKDFVESVIKPVEHDKSHLKQLPKAERKIIKSIRYNYRVTRSVYTSTH